MSKSTTSEDAPLPPTTPIPGVRSSLKTRLMATAFVGVAIVAAWLLAPAPGAMAADQEEAQGIVDKARVTLEEPFLPFTGADMTVLLVAAAMFGVAGVALRKYAHRKA